MRSSNVLKALAAESKVLEFTPPKFELDTPEAAVEYLNKKKNNPKFRMSEVIRIQTGVKEIEEQTAEESVENKVLERIQDVQEKAYKEAYQLGLEEGRKEAFVKTKNEIDTQIEKLGQLILQIENMKTQLFKFNESHLMKLILHLSERLAYAQIKIDPSPIVEVMREAIQKSQLDEEVSVDIAPSQFAFLEELKKQTNREFEFLKKVKLQPSEGVTEGGCVIHTNYGQIDARIEERVNTLWSAIEETLIKVKDKVAS